MSYWPASVPTALQLLTALNNTKVLLDVSAGISDTVITVDDASSLPASGYLTFDDNETTPETIYYAARTGTTLTGVTRGADGTAVATHTADGTTGLEMRPNAEYHNRTAAEVIAIAQNISDRFSVGTDIVVPAARTFTLAKTSNQLILGATRTVTITAPTPATASRTWTVPDIGADGTFAALETAQTFAGTKTFAAGIPITATTNQLILGTTNTVTLTAPAPAASRVLTIPDPGGAADFVMTAGAQTIGGTKTFSAAPVVSALTASTVPYLDASKVLASSAVTPTELGYLSGATSALQTQITARAALTGAVFTGDVTLDNQKGVKFREPSGGGTNSVYVRAGGNMAADYSILLPIAAPSANSQVMKVSDYTTGLMEWGTGGGQGGINYVINPDAEADASGYSAYADAAGTTPVDGTGGSPTTTLTRVTSSPLRGTGMFRVTKDAANRQGEGVGYAFTIDTADKARILAVSFDYQPSAAFVSGDSSDLRVWVYDVTNAVLIPVTPYTIQGGSSLPNTFKGVFQTSSNSTSYRLILHVATTNASAWTFDFDNVSVGPQVIVYGAPVTDWKSFTPTGSWVSNTTYTGKWRRVGDSMEIYYRATLSGAPTATDLLFNLPSGYTIDTAKLNSAGGSAGSALINDSGTRFYVGTVNFSSTQVSIMHTESGNFGSVNATNPQTWASGDSIDVWVVAPIVGWGSNVQMSNDADTRVVAAEYQNSAGTSFTAATAAVVPFATKVQDTHGAVSGSGTAWIFTAPVAGTYRVQALLSPAPVAWTSGDSVEVELLKNGAFYSRLAHMRIFSSITASLGVTGSTTLVLAAGDTVAVRLTMDRTNTLTAAAGYNRFTIERISGPAAIAASETVACRYKTAAGQSMADNTEVIVDFGTKEFDTHGAVTTGASWVFTAPVPGIYRISAAVMLAAGGGWAAGELAYLRIFKNGVTYNYVIDIEKSTHAQQVTRVINTTIKLIAGDTLQVKFKQGSGGAIALDTDANENFVDIQRIGI